MTIAITLMSLIMATIVMAVRIKRAKQAISLKQIVLPPLFMSTGFIMFLYPPMHVPVLYAVESLFMGMILSIPLILTSKFEVKGPDIFLKRSKLFVLILLGLFLTRMGLRVYLEEFISFYETGALFYILAIGMIFPWRIAMAIRYKQLIESIKNGSTSTEQKVLPHL